MGASMSRRRIVAMGAAGAALPLVGAPVAAADPMEPDKHDDGPGRVFDVRRFGARGDGVTIDSDAINRAIDAAANGPGGTVYFPAQTTCSSSLKSTLRSSSESEPGLCCASSTNA